MGTSFDLTVVRSVWESVEEIADPVIDNERKKLRERVQDLLSRSIRSNSSAMEDKIANDSTSSPLVEVLDILEFVAGVTYIFTVIGTFRPLTVEEKRIRTSLGDLLSQAQQVIHEIKGTAGGTASASGERGV